MPPKALITREKIVSAGLEFVRRNGAEALNVRKVASELKCSTQPIMYQFSTVEELKAAIYAEADKFHSEYIMAEDANTDDLMLAIGMRYIRFAAEERHLFRFLFQSDKYADKGFDELISDDELAPVFEILQAEAEITEKQSREAFATLFLTAHGIASLLANNSLEYNENEFAEILSNVFMGVIGAMKGGNV